ncbi:hypothetical protein ACFWUP_24270 [Nocardia sp. NPDC058658]|uniref:hypothetical protein n=1 Tax=Nocardia sp. NPDC058658 TaxID=3346580 RepID=UPI0036622266
MIGVGAALLHSEIDAFYAGFGNATALRESLRVAVLLVPLVDGGRISTHAFGGVDWICAFTEIEEYIRWISARGAADSGSEYPYHSMYGWRLVDCAAGCANPTGTAVDIIGSEPMAFPPTALEDGADDRVSSGG